LPFFNILANGGICTLHQTARFTPTKRGGGNNFLLSHYGMVGCSLYPEYVEGLCHGKYKKRDSGH